MVKKLAALLCVVIGAYIFLPFGFSLWNESIGVRGQISFAESSAEPTQKSAEEQPDNQSEAGQDAIADEPSNPGQTLTDAGSESASTASAPDYSSGKEPGLPQPVMPVGAAEDIESPEPASDESETEG